MGVFQGLVLPTTTYCNIQRQRHHAKTSHIGSFSRCFSLAPHRTGIHTPPPGHPEPEKLASETRKEWIPPSRSSSQLRGAVYPKSLSWILPPKGDKPPRPQLTDTLPPSHPARELEGLQKSPEMKKLPWDSRESRLLSSFQLDKCHLGRRRSSLNLALVCPGAAQ